MYNPTAKILRVKSRLRQVERNFFLMYSIYVASVKINAFIV